MYSILIVEDDASLAGNMSLILEMEGFAVRRVSNGINALAAVHGHLPDLILCDIMMPEMGGHEFLEKLKQDSPCAAIPFIFVTALDQRSDMRRGMSAGADDYLTKPFSADELVTAVTGRLQRLERMRLRGGGRSSDSELDLLRRQVSPRELQVLLLVGQGATSREIAERLGISLRTAEVHRSNLMRKLNVVNAAALARWAGIAELL